MSAPVVDDEPDTVARPFTPLDRRVLMLRMGVRQSDVGRATGASAAVVCRAISGENLTGQKGPRVARYIARRLGRPLELVFPELARKRKPPAV